MTQTQTKDQGTSLAATVIKPTIGRVVWFWPAVIGNPFVPIYDQPCAAIVTHVWGDDCVNLCVFSPSGDQYGMTSVPLIQASQPKPEEGYFCQWMPYQLGQAAKAEAAGGAGVKTS